MKSIFMKESRFYSLGLHLGSFISIQNESKPEKLTFHTYNKQLKGQMNFMERDRTIINDVERIGGIIPIGKITLLTGLPGTGKSYTTVKFLNHHLITPLYFNLDETSIDSLNAEMFGEDDLIDLINPDNHFDDISDKVIIIDTYIRFEDIIGQLPKTKIVSMLESMIERYGFTIIIIGHPEDYVGKDSIFKDNPILIRHCYEHIHLEKKNHSSTSKGITTISETNITYIKKGRANGGSKIIQDWMREPNIINQIRS